MDIQIQYQDDTGTWYTIGRVLNNGFAILQGMKSASAQHPGKRIRAVDHDGRIVDIL